MDGNLIPTFSFKLKKKKLFFPLLISYNDTSTGRKPKFFLSDENLQSLFRDINP